MNIDKLNQAFIEIAEKKIELSRFDVQDPQHEIILNEIRDLESGFSSSFGSFVEEALFTVHDEYCPDNDVLLPIAYMASLYSKRSNKESSAYDVDADQGIVVEADDFPGTKARLVLVPDPTRLILQSESAEFKETVWVAN